MGKKIEKAEYEKALKDYGRIGEELDDAKEDGNDNTKIEKLRKELKTLGDIIHAYERDYEYEDKNESLKGLKHMKLFEEFLNEEEEKYNAFYLLSSSSKVNTTKPEENDLIDGWKNDKMSFFLVKSRLNPNGIIVAGSQSASNYGLKVGGTMYMFDDGNRTTKFPTSFEKKYDHVNKRMATKRRHPAHGLAGTVMAIASSSEEITKNFPKGSYSLVVMK